MLSRTAASLVPLFGRLSVTGTVAPAGGSGTVLVANHTSLTDPAVVLAALHRLGVRPVVMATAGLWRVPLLGRALDAEGHIPVARGTARASAALDAAAEALAQGRVLLMYAEGRLPARTDAADSAPGPFRSGLARLTERTGALVVPIGQAGARRLSSGSTVKQLAGVATAPLRRPSLHVHVGAPVRLTGDVAARTDQAHAAVTDAWRTAAAQVGAQAGEPARRSFPSAR
ncbi:lysophospholipid acyltransferase family protein [Streptomyces sp. NPDC098789]|uniref:lysophospholipid acyltransferase family protein n=1 Tax=Streptomyces sp. NPDC098789 TaxID=3366098 RepID=UPI003801C30C